MYDVLFRTDESVPSKSAEEKSVGDRMVKHSVFDEIHEYAALGRYRTMEIDSYIRDGIFSCSPNFCDFSHASSIIGADSHSRLRCSGLAGSV